MIDMWKIIRVNRGHINELAQIDFESEHKLARMRNVSIDDRRTELIERFTKHYELFFGYKENGELKGYITMKPFFPGHKHCELYWLAVKNKYQSQGIGTRLIDFIENYANEQGFRKICLYTNKLMDKTRNFYEKRGYKLINEFTEYYGYPENNTAVLYCKKLGIN